MISLANVVDSEIEGLTEFEKKIEVGIFIINLTYSF